MVALAFSTDTKILNVRQGFKNTFVGFQFLIPDVYFG